LKEILHLAIPKKIKKGNKEQSQCSVGGFLEIVPA